MFQKEVNSFANDISCVNETFLSTFNARDTGEETDPLALGGLAGAVGIEAEVLRAPFPAKTSLKTV